MPNTRIAGPTYARVQALRDRLATEEDRQVTVSEVIARLLDIAEAADAAEAAAYTAGRGGQPPPGRHRTRPANAAIAPASAGGTL